MVQPANSSSKTQKAGRMGQAKKKTSRYGALPRVIALFDQLTPDEVRQAHSVLTFRLATTSQVNRTELPVATPRKRSSKFAGSTAQKASKPEPNQLAATEKIKSLPVNKQKANKDLLKSLIKIEESNYKSVLQQYKLPLNFKAIGEDSFKNGGEAVTEVSLDTLSMRRVIEAYQPVQLLRRLSFQTWTRVACKKWASTLQGWYNPSNESERSKDVETLLTLLKERANGPPSTIEVDEPEAKNAKADGAAGSTSVDVGN